MMNNLKEINAQLDQLDKEYDEAFNLPTVDQYMDACKENWKRRMPILFEKQKLTEVTFINDIPDYGDLMTIEEFKECCEDGGFIDYDGSGVYSDGVRETNISAIASMFKAGLILDNPLLTHILWFNK